MNVKPSLLATGLLFSLTTLNAEATLTTVDNGLGVYSSVSNVTWTQDANLLGTLEANAISQYGNDNSLITNIINASGGVIHDTPNDYDNGTYTLTAADFGSGGTVDWWAGQAFVHYLDTQDYGGSSQWALPTSNAVVGWVNGSQLGELFYNELGGIRGSSIPSGPFSNVQAYVYWSGTEYAANPLSAWGFVIGDGYQGTSSKYDQSYAWAVSPGQLSTVPVPGAVWLFGTGLLGLLGLKRRVHAG